MAEHDGVGDEVRRDGDAGNPREVEPAATGWSTRAVVGLLGAAIAVVVGWQWLGTEPEQPNPAPTANSDEAAQEPTDVPDEAAQEPTDVPDEAAPAPAERAEEATPEPAQEDPLPFDEPTGAALIFDAGADGAVVVDLDTGTSTRFRLPRGDTEEQPFPLLRRGEWLVVAQHGGWSLAPGGGPDVTVHSLGDGGFAVPAAQTDQVWLVDDNRGRDDGTHTWTLVEVTGAMLAHVEVEEGYTPIRGVPGGLAVRDEEGAVLVYDVDADGFDHFLEVGAHVVDATTDRAITCSEGCEELAVRDEHGEVIQRLHTDGVRAYGVGWLSADGRLLAVRAGVDVVVGGQDAADVQMHVYDVDKGELLDRTQTTLGDFAGSWTQDDEQFFYRTVTLGPPTPLVRYTVGEGFDSASLDAQAAPLAHFAAFSREALRSLLDQPHRAWPPVSG